MRFFTRFLVICFSPSLRGAKRRGNPECCNAHWIVALPAVARNDGAISQFLAGILIAIALLGVTVSPSQAQETQVEIRLADEGEERRARELFRELRCEVCEGQTIADSNAPLAQDMRAAVRTKVASGESDDHILGYFSERYGRDILMRPPVDASTAPLWMAPLFVVLLGAWFIMRYFSRRKASHF